jgi:hypothetical protein
MSAATFFVLAVIVAGASAAPGAPGAPPKPPGGPQERVFAQQVIGAGAQIIAFPR